MNPPRHLPGDGFPWFLFLILGLHTAVGGALLRFADRPISVPRSAEAASDSSSAFAPAEVRWVTASLSLPPLPPPPIPSLPPDSSPATNEPESDLPLPSEPGPKPEPKSEPRLRPLPELRPAPAPLPPPPPRPTPTPKAVSSPPKLVAAVPLPPVPHAAPILKPAPAPIPASDPVVAKAVPISRPVPVAVPMSTPASGVPSESGSSSSGPDRMTAFHQEVREAYMSRWQQPRGLLTTGAKFRVRAEIIIDPTGNVVSARIVSPSGNAEVDQSVRDTVRQVPRVPPPPSGLAAPTYSVILNFDL